MNERLKHLSNEAIDCLCIHFMAETIDMEKAKYQKEFISGYANNDLTWYDIPEEWITHATLWQQQNKEHCSFGETPPLIEFAL